MKWSAHDNQRQYTIHTQHSALKHTENCVILYEWMVLWLMHHHQPDRICPWAVTRCGTSRGLPSLSFIYIIIFFFSSHLSVLSKHTIGTGCFSPSHSLSHSFALCVCLCMSHTPDRSRWTSSNSRGTQARQKKYIRKWDSTATASLGWEVVVPRHGVIRIFFVVFSLSVCVLLTLCHPFYRSYDTFIYSYRPFGEKQTYAWLRICFLYIFMAGKV